MEKKKIFCDGGGFLGVSQTPDGAHSEEQVRSEVAQYPPKDTTAPSAAEQRENHRRNQLSGSTSLPRGPALEERPVSLTPTMPLISEAEDMS